MTSSHSCMLIGFARYTICAAASIWWEGVMSLSMQSFLTGRAARRACLKLHAAEANTNYPTEDYEGELEAAALLSAVPLSAAAAPGASDAGNSDDEDARRSELELSAMHGVLQMPCLCHPCYGALLHFSASRSLTFHQVWCHIVSTSTDACCPPPASVHHSKDIARLGKQMEL